MRTEIWGRLGNYRDHGLLVIRVGLGLSFMMHGWPKVAGGADGWAKLGQAMSVVGIGFAPTAWGLAAALAEFVGGFLLAIGMFTRPTCAALAFTMFVAWKMHFDAGDGFGSWSHAFEDGVMFLGLMLLGPGRFSVDGR